MKKDLAANHPNIKLVDTVYGDDDDQTSFDKTAALLQPHPNLKGIISPTTVGIAAAARYLSTRTHKGKVALTGLGTPNQMREYVKDGTVTAFALWNPEDLGYLAAYAAKALVDGDITGEEGDTFKAGKLGEFTVGADGDRAARRAVRLQRRQHRRVQLLSVPTGRRASRARRPAPSPPPRPPRPRSQSCASASSSRSGPTGSTSTAPGTPRSGPTCSQALAETGWHNYSLFLRGDGLLIGYFETPSLEDARRGMARTEVNARWQAEMAEFFEELDGPRPDQGFLVLEEVFHLEDQLRASRPATRPRRTEVSDMTTFSEIRPLLEGQAIEVPSWAYGNSGTRFKVFGTPGTPRTVEEKIADAAPGAPVHRARAARWRCTSRGTWSTTSRALRALRRGPRRRRSARSTPTPSRTTTTSSAP